MVDFGLPNASHGVPDALLAISNRQGTRMVADTTYPDIGLQLFDPHAANAAPRTLCSTAFGVMVSAMPKRSRSCTPALQSCTN